MNEAPTTTTPTGSKAESDTEIVDLGFSPGTANIELASRSAEERVAWALEQFGDAVAMSSSFGAQSAVTLHMVSQQRPGIPVILIDTGYLFKETYQFVDELTDRLSLNLQVHRPPTSPAWQEARFGKLWEQGLEGIEEYNRINKVEPMSRALEELGVRAWIVGLRRQQSEERSRLQTLAVSDGRVKVHPIIDWTDRDVFQYLKEHELPYHPLWNEGYVSIGDTHTTRKLTDGMSTEDTRFFGLKRECGLHENVETDFVI
jgi:phosphoadenosine phosphosulfate reductase